MRFTEYLKYTSSSRRITESSSSNVQPKTKKELIQIIKDTIKKEGYNCDLNFIDTSLITNMIELFYVDVLNKFNGDISKWEPFSVEDMSGMFRNSKFNSDVSKWDVSTVKDMSGMFMGSKFSKDISKWDVSDVESHRKMFDNSPLENKPEFQPKFNKELF